MLVRLGLKLHLPGLCTGPDIALSDPWCTPWFLPVVALVSVLIIIAGLFMLVAQVPRKATTSPLKFSGSEGVLMFTGT